MENHQINYSQIRLQENIPLTEEEIRLMEEEQKGVMRMFVITFVIGILFIGIIGVLSVEKETLYNLKYYDYIGFVGVGLILFVICFFIAWVADGYNIHNWEKDKSQGKNKLTSVVINRDKTEHAEYLTFAGPLENQKIRIEVKQEDFSHYKIGAEVIVIYLKYSRRAIEVIGN